jgi:hypothetical protein
VIPTPPLLDLPTAPSGWRGDRALLDLAWTMVPTLPPFRRAQDGSPARQQTVARLLDDGTALYAHFSCSDGRIVAPRTGRDTAIFHDEVVELFIAAGDEEPTEYFEFEVSPAAVLLDARIRNPRSRRDGLEVDVEWDCPGIGWAACRDDAAGRWVAALRVPWGSLTETPTEQWRLNLYRIDRAENPKDDEYSCWSPTMTAPADFHRPAAFAHMRRGR